MTGEMYIEKALELNTGIDERMALIHKILAFSGGGIKSGISKDYLFSALWDAQAFSQADSRGFGIFIDNIEYIKRLMSVDLSESKLLEIMSDSKTIKIFLLICINGSLNESEILNLSGFTNEKVKERLFEMLKC